jgi:hypothetical protein
VRTGAAVGAGFSVLGEGDLDTDEPVAGPLAVRAGIVQPSALSLPQLPSSPHSRTARGPLRHSIP